MFLHHAAIFFHQVKETLNCFLPLSSKESSTIMHSHTRNDIQQDSSEISQPQSAAEVDELVFVVDEMSDSEGETDDSLEENKKHESRDYAESDEALSLDDLLQEKAVRIEALERMNRIKEERLQLLQQKFNETKAKHKEGIYWLQLELDGARRDSNATEEHMAELMNDLQSMTKIPNPNELSEKMFRDKTVMNYEQVIASMQNQISMMKTSAGEIVKTLKEEISELMEDRASMEVDLMNQLSVLANEKAIREAEMEHQLKAKSDMIQRLLSAGGTTSTSAETTDVEEYEAEIIRLTEEKMKIEETMSRECEQAYEEVQKLELANAELKADLDRVEERLESSHQGSSNGFSRSFAEQQEETMVAIKSLRDIWERTEGAIATVSEQLRANPLGGSDGEENMLLSTLDTASLVHHQANISLALIELKLKNSVEQLKNSTNGDSSPNDTSVHKQMETIQEQVLLVLKQVEKKISGQFQDIQKSVLEDSKHMQVEAQGRASTLDAMDDERKAFGGEIERLKSAAAAASRSSENGKSSLLSDIYASNAANGISRAVMNQLQTETLRVIERINEKNTLIQAMQKKLEESKASEERLKKELKRALRSGKPTTPTKANASPNEYLKKPNTEAFNAVSPNSSKTSSPTPKPTTRRQSAATPMQSPSPTPKSATRRHSDATPMLSPKATVSKMPMISPLAPSPREISKPRRQSLSNPIAS